MDLQRVTVDPRTLARWQARTQAERASAVAMADIADRLAAHLPDGEGWARALRLAAADEDRHAQLCEAQLQRLGGTLPPDAPDPGLPPTAAQTPLEGLVENVVFLLCAGEAIAAAMLTEGSRGASPDISELLDAIRVDEVRHGLLGWRLLDALLDAVDTSPAVLAEPCTRQALRAVVAAARVGAVGPDSRTLGLLDAERAEAIAKQTLVTHIGPALQQRGLWATPGTGSQAQ